MDRFCVCVCVCVCLRRSVCDVVLRSGFSAELMCIICAKVLLRPSNALTETSFRAICSQMTLLCPSSGQMAKGTTLFVVSFYVRLCDCLSVQVHLSIYQSSKLSIHLSNKYI